ncbi:MAG: hypothetical protein JSV88_08680 [Candidatus Aminicenantes bacterium]|nr:MAG: hypothetical protein JSV88_08680 [Candidatus Aminicenantes bacterium]
MSKLVSRIDLSILPDNAVKLLMDFYDFLVERYGKNKTKSKSTSDKDFDKFISESIEVEEIVRVYYLSVPKTARPPHQAILNHFLSFH